jgi:PleD family two-component response regulator
VPDAPDGKSPMMVVETASRRVPRFGVSRRAEVPICSSPVAIRIVLAEDSFLVREGVRRLLETQPGFEVAAVCEDFDSLLAAVEEQRPDVVLTDIRMPPGRLDEGIQAAPTAA